VATQYQRGVTVWGSGYERPPMVAASFRPEHITAEIAGAIAAFIGARSGAKTVTFSEVREFMRTANPKDCFTIGPKG
jgi:hypothetical protein